MSVRVIDAVFRRSRAKGSARLVLLALADVAADSGEISAYPRSHRILAAKANVDAGTVRRSIDRLVELGELEVTAVGDGRASSNYRVLLMAEGVQDAHPPADGEGVQDAHPGGAGRAPRDGDVPTLGVQDARPISTSLPVPPPSPPGGKPNRKVRLPDDFAVDLAMRSWAAENAPLVDVDAELDQFVDYWRGRGETRADWVATWRTWMRRAQDDRAAPRGGRARPRPPRPIAPRQAPTEGGRVAL